MVDITTKKFKEYYEGKVDYEKILKDPKKRKKYQKHWDKAEKNKQKRLAIEAMKPEDAGYKTGGRAGHAIGHIVKAGKMIERKLRKPKPHRDKPPSKTHKDVPTMAAKGGRIGLKKGGSDKKWIQKAVNPKHKGYCTPMTKKTCTPARKALARTFKKKAKTGW